MKSLRLLPPLLTALLLALGAITAACGEDSEPSAVTTQTATGEPTNAGSVLAIVNGRLFDGTGAAPVEDGVVIVKGNSILEVGRSAKVEIPSSARIIDADGGLIMPGVIDSHVHVTHAVEQQEDAFTPWLRSGVTSLVDNGTFPEFAGSLQGRVEDLAEQSPRLFLAGPILTSTGGFPFTVGLEGLAISSAEDAVTQVGNLLDQQGVDFIKVAIEAGFGTDLENPEWPVLPPETLAAIAEAATTRGKTARAHVTHPQEFESALDAGFDVMAHMPIVPMPSDLLQRAADADVIVVSTASFWGPAFVTAAENLSRYADLGGRIALGSDAGTFPLFGGVGEMPLAEMSRLIEGGLTPAEVLVAATKHGAEAINRGDDLGTLEPGKLADIIVVAGDPLSDVGDMANVMVVIRDGEIIVAQVDAEVILPDEPAEGFVLGDPSFEAVPGARAHFGQLGSRSMGEELSLPLAEMVDPMGSSALTGACSRPPSGQRSGRWVLAAVVAVKLQTKLQTNHPQQAITGGHEPPSRRPATDSEWHVTAGGRTRYHRGVGVWDQEVGSSNLPTPTTEPNTNRGRSPKQGRPRYSGPSLTYLLSTGLAGSVKAAGGAVEGSNDGVAEENHRRGNNHDCDHGHDQAVLSQGLAFLVREARPQLVPASHRA